MRTILALCSVLVFSGCVVVVAPDGDNGRIETNWSNKNKGNGDVISVKREVASVSGLSVSGSVQTEVRVGLAPSLEIIGDSNILPLIRTEVVNNAGGKAKDAVLKIWSDESYSTNANIRIIYTTPMITSVEKSGSGHLSINGFTSGNVDVNKSGSGTVFLQGHVNDLNIDVSGSGVINAGQLESRSVNVNKSGSGSVVMGSVTQNFSAKTSGSGQITVQGNPPQRSVEGKNVFFVATTSK